MCDDHRYVTCLALEKDVLLGTLHQHWHLLCMPAFALFENWSPMVSAHSGVSEALSWTGKVETIESALLACLITCFSPPVR